MNKLKLIFAVVLLLCLFGYGCSHQKSEPRHQAPGKGSNSGDFVVVAGLTKGQATTFSDMLKKADEKFKPLKVADDYMNTGKFKEAIAIYQEAMKRDDLAFMATRGLVRAYEKLGDYKTALSYLEQSPPKASAFAEYQKKLSELKSKVASQTKTK